MKQQEWHQIETWVHQILALPAKDRHVMLAELRRNHGALGREAAQLVEAHKHIEHFLEPPLGNALFNATIAQSKKRNLKSITEKQTQETIEVDPS